MIDRARVEAIAIVIAALATGPTALAQAAPNSAQLELAKEAKQLRSGVTFEVTGPGTHRFDTHMHHYRPEKAWVLTEGLPTSFLDAFSVGDALVIRNGEGDEVDRFGLSGSTGVVAKMREYCRI